MRKWFWISAVVVVVLTLAIGGGTVLASRNVDRAASQETVSQWGGYLDNPTLNRVATVLGITPTELIAQLQSGKTIAQVAKDKGIVTDKVVEALLAPHKDQLQLRVKYGYITQEQADQLLTTAKSQAEFTLNQTFTSQGVSGDKNNEFDDMYKDCNNMMGGVGMDGMMGGSMMGGYGSGWNAPATGNSSGFGGRGMMGGGMMGGSGNGAGTMGGFGRGMMGTWW